MRGSLLNLNPLFLNVTPVFLNNMALFEYEIFSKSFIILCLQRK